MKKLDIYTVLGRTSNDEKIILKAIEENIDLMVDDYGRVFNEGGIYIADVVDTYSGNGIGCKIGALA